MRKYTVQAGKHDFRPVDSLGIVAPWVKEATYKVRFGPDCAYTLPGEDQADWNKGGGFTFSLFSNTKNAVMWAWRWSPAIGRIQLCAYWHKGGKAFYAETENDFPFAVALVEDLVIRIFKTGKVWAVQFTAANGTFSRITTATGTPVRPIGLWFGGNRPAPKEMSIFLDRKI